MSKFLTPLSDHQIGVRLWQLDADLEYNSDLLLSTVRVPKGFVTDYESCPVWLPVINSIFGNLTDEGAVVHDWLYYTALYPRKVADEVLRESMELIPGLATWRIAGVYDGLRLGGWYAWNQHRKLGHSIKDFTSQA